MHVFEHPPTRPAFAVLTAWSQVKSHGPSGAYQQPRNMTEIKFWLCCEASRDKAEMHHLLEAVDSEGMYWRGTYMHGKTSDRWGSQGFVGLNLTTSRSYQIDWQ